MDARLVFLLMLVVLFGAKPLWLTLRRQGRSHGRDDHPAGPPDPDACHTPPTDVAPPAWMEPQTLEDEVESGPESLPYSFEPEDVRDVHLRRAHFRAARGDIAGAISDYEQAEQWESWSGYGPGVFEFGMTEACDQSVLLAGLDALLAAHPDSWPALRERAYQRLCAGDADGAIRDCDAVLAYECDDGFCRALRGLARRRSGDAAGAWHDLDAAVASASPKNPWPSFARAGLALLDDAPAAALADLRGHETSYSLRPYRRCLMDGTRRRLSGVALAYPVPQEGWVTLHRLFGPAIAARIRG